jgi:hypothetical protein
MSDEERRENKLEAYSLSELEESGVEKLDDLTPDTDSDLVLVGDKGPVPYEQLLTKAEFSAFQELAQKSEPTQEEVARGHALLRLMMKRYPDGPAPE